MPQPLGKKLLKDILSHTRYHPGRGGFSLPEKRFFFVILSLPKAAVVIRNIERYTKHTKSTVRRKDEKL